MRKGFILSFISRWLLQQDEVIAAVGEREAARQEEESPHLNPWQYPQGTKKKFHLAKGSVLGGLWTGWKWEKRGTHPNDQWTSGRDIAFGTAAPAIFGLLTCINFLFF